MCFTRKVLLFQLAIAFFSLLATNELRAQLTQPFFHHYSTANGLPSSETYCVTQDRDGYLWFGTDNGVARFDGYEFKTYGLAEGLTDVVVFNVVEDSHGRLWFLTFSGRVFYLENGRFIPFAHNESLVEIKHRVKYLNLIDVTADGTLVITTMRTRIYSINQNGEITNLDKSPNPGSLIYYRNLPGQQFGRQGYVHNFNNYSPALRGENMDISILKNDGSISTNVLPNDQIRFKNIDDQPFYSPNYLAYRPVDDLTGEVLNIIDGQIYYHSASNEITTYQHGHSLSNYAIPHPEKGFWVALGRGLGLLHVYLVDKPTGKVIQIDRSLSGVSVNHIGYDEEGGLWVCSQDRGVFYSPNPNLNTYAFQNGDNISVPVALQLLDGDHYLASYDSREIINHTIRDGSTRKLKLIFQKVTTAYDLHYDHENQLTYTTNGLYDNQNQHFTSFDKLIDITESGIGYVTYLKRYQKDAHSRYFICDSNNAWYFDAAANMGSIHKVFDDSTRQHSVKCFGQDYQNRFLMGTLEGLYVQGPEGQFVADDLGIPALNTRISSIDQLLNGGTLIATRGAGLVYLSARGKNTISEEDGLVSNIVRGIHQADNGDIWINSLSGLSKLRLALNGDIEELRSFTTHHGLASNEIHDVDSYNNDIWLASGGGVIDFEEVPLNTVSNPPIITSLTVDGDVISPDSLDFSQGQHDLKISFNTINYQMLGKIPYRYRLTSTDEWEYTNSRTVEYPNLSSGDYRFEVQSRNQDRIWSESNILLLSIPYQWYNRWYFYLLGVLTIVVIVAGIFKLREQQRIQKQKIQDQIDDLERAAVQAQMNPHFVFNSLNSIQYFILQNDTKQAVYYLSRFASLIRQTLRASVKGIHSLKDEVNMLEIYLSLEKLRFKEIFDYQIELNPDLPAATIKIPPMLVQPFVENAILHGLAEVDTGGLVTVTFSGSPQEIVATVVDNGCGFDPAASITSDSMGSRITQRRLQKMGHNCSDPVPERISIISSTGEDGRPHGTTVTLIIPGINQ
ncbi:hypothetical protein CEQ90_16910 [Lewinellaceae bacterium SD302]|nr:hypothetical protein CEQ90_16910 [Lewinellaceae bacterium SD302]